MVFFSLWLNMKVISPSLQSRKINFEGIQIRQILNSHFNSIINRMYICLLWVCSNYNVHTSSSYVKACWVKEKKKEFIKLHSSSKDHAKSMSYLCNIVVLLILVVFSLSLTASNANSFESFLQLPRRPPRSTRTRPRSERLLHVGHFGAKGNGFTDDTKVSHEPLKTHS